MSLVTLHVADSPVWRVLAPSAVVMVPVPPWAIAVTDWSVGQAVASHACPGASSTRRAWTPMGRAAPSSESAHSIGATGVYGPDRSAVYVPSG